VLEKVRICWLRGYNSNNVKFTCLCCVVCSAISELLVSPLQERMDDWKKTAVALDREHTRGRLLSSLCFVSKIVSLALLRE